MLNYVKRCYYQLRLVIFIGSSTHTKTLGLYPGAYFIPSKFRAGKRATLEMESFAHGFFIRIGHKHIYNLDLFRAHVETITHKDTKIAATLFIKLLETHQERL